MMEATEAAISVMSTALVADDDKGRYGDVGEAVGAISHCRPLIGVVVVR